MKFSCYDFSCEELSFSVASSRHFRLRGGSVASRFPRSAKPFYFQSTWNGRFGVSLSLRKRVWPLWYKHWAFLRQTVRAHSAQKYLNSGKCEIKRFQITSNWFQISSKQVPNSGKRFQFTYQLPPMSAFKNCSLSGVFPHFFLASISSFDTRCLSWWPLLGVSRFILCLEIANIHC